MWRRFSIFAVSVCLTLVLSAVGAAQIGPNPLNDLFAVGQGGGQMPATVPMQQNPEPPLTATPPPASCDPGSRPEPGVDGRVPAGSATDGLWCNLRLVSHQGESGGFKTFRYVDAAGHVCAFYDTALLFPTNAFNPGGRSLGVAVLDMSDPAHPVQTDTLATAAMLSPHESLNLNESRGLLAAVLGNPDIYPGDVSVYDVHADCRHPVLDADGPFARFGHESGFSVDGRTFYATSVNANAITAIDLTDPRAPQTTWLGAINSHGMTLSDDGNRAYIADTRGQLLILDTSEIQARKADPQVREISRLTWASASIPQNAIPFTEHGHPYLLEFDEYNQATGNPISGDPDKVGAARIIDIADERHPFVVSNLRLQVNQPAEHHAAANDPGAISPVQGYAAHYCNVPTEVDPKLVACSFILSGLRVFDISDLTAPKEIGYFVAPTKPRIENGYTQPSDFTMSKPAFDLARHDIWYTDGPTGFYVVHIDDSVWPSASHPASCSSPRRFVVRLRLPHGGLVRSIRATLDGKTQSVTRHGGTVIAVVNPRGLPRTVRLVIRVRLSDGRTITSAHTYHACSKTRARRSGTVHARRRARARSRSFTG